MGAPGLVIGALLASSFVVQLIVSPLVGRLSDRCGRKRIFILCSLLSASSMAAYALAPSLWGLLLSRILAGLGAPSTAVAQAAIADSWGEDDRADALGRLGAAQTAGMVLGPVAGGYAMSTWGSEAGGLGALLLAVLGCFIGALLYEFKKGSIDQVNRQYGFRSLARKSPQVIPLFGAVVISWFSLALLEGTFGRLIHRTLQLGAFEFGVVFAFESLIWVVMSAFLLGPILKPGREELSLAASYLLMGIGLALMPYAPSFAWLLLLALLFAAGHGFASPAATVLCARRVEEERQGEVFGLLQGSRAIGFILGPVIGGVLFDYQHSLPYLVAGGVCGCAALVSLGAVDRRRMRL